VAQRTTSKPDSTDELIVSGDLVRVGRRFGPELGRDGRWEGR
jgi:hypothetical protein